MTITKNILERCENAVKDLENNKDWNALIRMDDEDHSIDYIVQRANSNYYFGTASSPEYIYWERSRYGFNFIKGLFNSTNLKDL